jgi:RND family efflux transporter MFP subunit
MSYKINNTYITQQMKRSLITLSTIIAVSIFAISCNSDADENQNNGNERARLIPVETITIEMGSFEDYIRLTGTVEALEDALISSETSGRILSIAQRGQFIRKGDVIAQMDDRVIRAQYEAASTMFELADDTFKRLEVLYADSIISTQDFRNAKAQRDQAKAQLDATEKQLRDARLVAPFNGRVEERFIQSGELINPGMPVVRLVNTERVRVIAGVPENYSGQIREGSDALVNFRALNLRDLSSKVSFAANVIDGATRTFLVEIELDNRNELMKPDMVADIRLKRQTIENAVIIPRTAVIRDEAGTNVFIAKEVNGRKEAELRAVRTGMATGSIIQILEGIHDGEEVVIAGISTLSAGDQLNITKNQPAGELIRQLQNR